MNRDQVHALMTALAVGGSLVGGAIVTQHLVDERNGGIALPTTTPSASGSPSASATSSSTPSSSATSTASTKVSKTGDMIQGNDPYGDYIQLAVTKTDGKVTAVDVVQQYATPRWQSAYPYLAQEAVASNGAQVANLSGATYCSNVFNQALASAMSKF